MTEQTIAQIAAKYRGYSTQRRLLDALSRRWIKGTGFCHRSVADELIDDGCAEFRVKRYERNIRISPLGARVRAHLLSEGHDHDRG